MRNDVTSRGYQLPDRHNIASDDVMRMRNSFIAINGDIVALDDLTRRMRIEELLGIWR